VTARVLSCNRIRLRDQELVVDHWPEPPAYHTAKLFIPARDQPGPDPAPAKETVSSSWQPLGWNGSGSWPMRYSPVSAGQRAYTVRETLEHRKEPPFDPLFKMPSARSSKKADL
jgi:hypothetical protein